MATLPRVLTYHEWLRMPPVEDGTDEVVNGELRFMPPTRYPHAEIIRRLVKRFDAQCDENRICVLGSNFGLMIRREPLTCRSPDLALYWTDQMVIEDGLYNSAPGLIVEVLSPSEHEGRKSEKLADYEAIGVPEVWICSPQTRTVEVRTKGQSRTYTTGLLEPTKFPSVKIDVSTIWPD
jgi:Uma2 family endonuclease